MTQKVYGRGLNTFGQLCIPKVRSVGEFQQLPGWEGRKIKQIESHFSNNVALLDDNQVVYWGWAMDLLTQVRTLNWYKQGPRVVHAWQRMAPLGKYLSIRNYFIEPNLINKSMMHERIEKIQLGGCFVQALLENGEVYAMGENYKGQLGVGNVKFQGEFRQVTEKGKGRMVDIASGLQHSLLLSEGGVVYGSGRANWSQVSSPDQVTIDFFQTPQRMEWANSWVTQVASGFHHSIALTRNNQLFAWGMNIHGQCGTSNLSEQTVCSPHRVFLPRDTIISKIVCGKSHSAFFTEDNRVFVFGSNQHNQLARKTDYDLDVCSPLQVELNLTGGEKIVDIKAKFDRTCVITDQGNAYVWGGQDLRHLGGEYHPAIDNFKHLLQAHIKDVSLGYMHTILISQ